MESTMTESAAPPWWHHAWTAAKCWHRIRLGPVSLLVRLARSGPRQTRPFRLLGTRFRTQLERTGSVAHSVAVVEESARPLGSVLIAGVGRNFGTAAAHYYAEQGASVSLVARDAERMESVARKILNRGLMAHAYAYDLTHEHDVRSLISEVVRTSGVPELCIYAAENFCPGDILRTQLAAFEEAWRVNCLGAFIVGREIARLMTQRGSGTLVFMGGTSSLIGRAGYLNLSAGKHGLRSLAHVMARELGPLGVHVAHCIIDGEVCDEEADSFRVKAGHVARELLRLHQQPPDCWTSEMDLRPARERFWEHC